MFRRNDNEEVPPRPSTQNTLPPQMARTEPPAKTSVVGMSLHVKGEITGAEDLSIEGIVEGGINLKQNTVSVGKSGRVQAAIYAKIIHVEGEITGDLYASEAVVVHRTGCVRGNINSPRVTLEDGARLKGSIDTEVASVEVKMAAAPETPRAAEPVKKDATPKKPEGQTTTTSGAALQ